MIIEKKSPNQNDRKDGMRPTMLILHYTGTKTEDEADEIYMMPDRVSPHYMINAQGRITQYVEEQKRSWHAGQSSWDGITDINSASVGIEIVNGGHEFGLEDFPEQQIEFLIALINRIKSRWNIPDHYILGHSDVAPGRKIDPGEKFPWKKLNAAGIGLMPQEGATLDVSLADGLKKFGYDYTNDTDILKTEFCRHYLYDRYDQASEEDVTQALASLLSQKSSFFA